jgi:formylglycine-generating enzyme required for sulfatase activity
MKVSDYYFDVTEVSNREYAKFVSEKGYPAPEGWTGGRPPEGAEDNPVVNVTYHDAVEFCRWRTAGRKDGLTYRLPTEEEWEYAARGRDAGRANGKMYLYPWGDEWKQGLANTDEARLRHPQIVTANRNGASPFGILNLCGNVAEWTATDFNHYPGSDRETPREAGYSGTYQVVRGGSFDFKKEWATTITRAWARPTVKGPNLGFRCAADARR